MISNRQRRLAAKKLFDKGDSQFKLVTNRMNAPDWMTRAYSNNVYIVMINDNCLTTHGFAIRALVQKHDDTPIRNHWREMMNIKNELCGINATAIEYYPPESELIDVHNIYWMWIFSDGIIPKMIK